jgi:hypothetical protein
LVVAEQHVHADLLAHPAKLRERGGDLVETRVESGSAS